MTVIEDDNKQLMGSSIESIIIIKVKRCFFVKNIIQRGIVMMISETRLVQ